MKIETALCLGLFAAAAQAAAPELAVGYNDIDGLDFTALLSWSSDAGTPLVVLIR